MADNKFIHIKETVKATKNCTCTECGRNIPPNSLIKKLKGIIVYNNVKIPVKYALCQQCVNKQEEKKSQITNEIYKLEKKTLIPFKILACLFLLFTILQIYVSIYL